jgi:hypothetical protein
MDLADRCEALAPGALLVAESAEKAYRLGALDRFLKPWVRERRDSLEGVLDSCDTTSDDHGSFPVQASKELENERAWYQQLEYGLRALGSTPFLTAIYDPDRHRGRASGDGDSG